MGQAKSKTIKFPQYPQPPIYPPYYVYPVHPQAGFSQGYHLPVLPPTMPQLQTVSWPSQPRHSKKKKKKVPGSARISAQRPNPAPSAPPLPNVQPVPAGMLDNLPPGFVPQSITPNPPGAPGPVFPAGAVNSVAQGAVPPPLFTPGVPGNAQLTNFPPSEPILRRVATPFGAARPAHSDEEDEDNEQDYRSHRRATSDPLLSPPITANDPIASPHVPPNPLPLPPRDVYELSPYKQLVHLPNTMALLTARAANTTTVYPSSNAVLTRSATNPGMAGVGAGINAMLPQAGKKKKRFFSFRRGRDATAQSKLPSQIQHQLGNIQFVPIYQNAPGEIRSEFTPASAPTTVQKQAGPNADDGTSRSQAENPVPPVPTPPSPPPQRSPPPPGDGSDDDGMVSPDLHHTTSPVPHQSHHASVSQQQQQQQQPFYPLPPPQSQLHQSPQRSTSQPYLVSPNGNTIEFSHASLPEFVNHSPHRVMYKNKIYPSAMHLHEAMKFLETKPELAETIRNTENVEDVYPLTARLQAWVRPDWGTVFLEKMAEVLWHKFTQHHHLRSMLLKTGNARIVYSDHVDPYWGSGASFGAGDTFPGTNYLGKLLENVRERLREAGYNAL